MRIIINNGQGRGLSISMYWMHKVFFRDFPGFFGSCKVLEIAWKLQGTWKIAGRPQEMEG